MDYKLSIAIVLFVFLAGCGTLDVRVDYGGTPVSTNLLSHTDTSATLGVPATQTKTPSNSPTASLTKSPTQSATPAPSIRVVGISSNQDHTCAVTESGQVMCWGNNEYGQLGDGTQVNRNVPVEVQGLTEAKAVAAGWKHTCALIQSGGVKCWGYNKNGELGNGKTVDSSTPVAVIGLSFRNISIGIGDDHTCAVTDEGKLRCWGYNEFGQLGDGTTTSRSAPVEVQGLTAKVAAVSAGWGHTCVLTFSGGMKCWGNNEYGQLGYGQTVDYRFTAVDVLELSGGVIGIGAGGGQSCALKAGGGIRCWGNNNYGQLGDGTAENRNTPVEVSGISQGAAKVAAGWNHTCAVMGNGELKCWGWNYYGQLGDGSRTTQSKPTNARRLMESVKDVAAGYAHTCSVTVEGGVLCWGSNQYGQLGDGTNTDSTIPLGVVGLGAAGTPTSTATMTAANSPTRTGTPTLKKTLQEATTASASTGIAIAIASKDSHNCLLTNKHEVKCWGGNSFGQLGDGLKTDRNEPTAVSGLSDYVTAITTGRYPYLRINDPERRQVLGG